MFHPNFILRPSYICSVCFFYGQILIYLWRYLFCFLKSILPNPLSFLMPGVGLVSLAAVFVLSRNAPPQQTFLVRSFAWRDKNGCVGDYLEKENILLLKNMYSISISRSQEDYLSLQGTFEVLDESLRQGKNTRTEIKTQRNGDIKPPFKFRKGYAGNDNDNDNKLYLTSNLR